MTKQELYNIYQLLQSPVTARVGFKIAEKLGLNNIDLITLLWCKYSSCNQLYFGHCALKKQSRLNWQLMDPLSGGWAWMDRSYIIQQLIYKLKGLS